MDRIRNSRLLREYGTRSILFGFLSLLANLAFFGFNLGYAIAGGSMWYWSFALYYGSLILFRAIMIPLGMMNRRHHEGDEEKYLKRGWQLYLASGSFLTLISIAMGIAITVMIINPRPTIDSEILAIATATFTFIKAGLAIRNFLKARKEGDPFIEGLRNLGIAEALMALLSLTICLLATFGEGNGPESHIELKAVTGFACILLCLILSTYMIIKGAKKLGEDRNID